MHQLTEVLTFWFQSTVSIIISEVGHSLSDIEPPHKSPVASLEAACNHLETVASNRSFIHLVSGHFTLRFALYI